MQGNGLQNDRRRFREHELYQPDEEHRRFVQWWGLLAAGVPVLPATFRLKLVAYVLDRLPSRLWHSK